MEDHCSDLLCESITGKLSAPCKTQVLSLLVWSFDVRPVQNRERNIFEILYSGGMSKSEQSYLVFYPEFCNSSQYFHCFMDPFSLLFLVVHVFVLFQVFCLLLS